MAQAKMDNIDHIHKIGIGCVNRYLGAWTEVSLSLQNGFLKSMCTEHFKIKASAIY